MIYLIGGPPKCGKTTLAKLLSEKTNAPWVSTDTIQNAIKPYISTEEFEEKFPSSAMRYDTNDEKYSNHSTQEIIDAYRHQATTVWPAIEAFVDSEITEDNNYIVEGFHIEPELMNVIIAKHPQTVKAVVLVKTDLDLFVKNITRSTTPNDWIISRTKNPETVFPKIAEMTVAYAKALAREATDRELETVNLDQDFASQLNKLTRRLTSSYTVNS